jgi:hypothetical protein
MRVIDDNHWRGLDAPRIPPAQPAELNPLLRPLLAIAGRLMPRGRLPRAETELVILRVAELPMLIGHYEMVAATISSLGIQPEG